MKKIKRFTYPNAELFKYENTRVQISSLPTKDYGIEFKVLSNDLSQRAIHTVKKGRIVSTKLRISKEAAISIMVGLQEQLKKDGVI